MGTSVINSPMSPPSLSFIFYYDTIWLLNCALDILNNKDDNIHKREANKRTLPELRGSEILKINRTRKSEVGNFTKISLTKSVELLINNTYGHINDHYSPSTYLLIFRLYATCKTLVILHI